ncbi:MAG: hypothetical protein ACREBP_06805, partial [Sphingomicrobium sp.]
MSFIRTYHPLFAVAAEDDAGTRLAAISFAPTAACRKTLANHHIVFRARPAGFQLFYQTNPQSADPLLGRIAGRVRLTFSMQSAAPDLLARYQPDLTAQTGKQLYLHNLTPSGNIQTKNTLSVGASVQPADAAKIYPPVFRVISDLGGAPRPAAIRVRDKFDANAPADEFKIVAAPESARAETKIDLSKK